MDKFKKIWAESKEEVIAGITSFFAISYIIIVNPLILADAGIPINLSVFATIFASVIGCFIIGFWANIPIVLTPGMGINAFFTYTIVINMGFSWQSAIGISFLSSLIFLFISFTPIVELLTEAIPSTLKTGITVGIGLFLVQIGLEKAQLIQRGTNTFVEFGSLTNPHALLSIFGLLLSIFLFVKKINGAFFLGIIFTTIVGVLANIQDAATIDVKLEYLKDYSSILFKPDFSQMFSIPFLLAVFSMSMILIFESIGLLEGLIPQPHSLRRGLQATSITALISALLGTSPTVAAAESAAGIESGGKKGLTAIVAGFLFLLSLFFIPLLTYVPQAAIAPVIIITGSLMMKQLALINYDDFTEWFPAFLIIVMIPFTGSIATGLSFGFIFYPLMKLFSNDQKNQNKIMYVLGLLFLINLIFSSTI